MTHEAKTDAEAAPRPKGGEAWRPNSFWLRLAAPSRAAAADRCRAGRADPRRSRRDAAPQRIAARARRAARREEHDTAAATEWAQGPYSEGAYTIAADTVVCVGRRILPRCEIVEEAGACLRLLSGRTHRVYTGVTLITPKGAERSRLVETRLRFKRLSGAEIEAYLASGEWRGKAGGYAIQGLAGAFAVKLVGSYSSVVGLPLYETLSLLAGEGFPAHLFWLNRV